MKWSLHLPHCEPTLRLACACVCGGKLTRLVRPGVVRHLQHEHFATLEALSDGVDATDGGTLQPHGHQRLPQLLISVVLVGDLPVAPAADHHRHGPQQNGPKQRLHLERVLVSLRKAHYLPAAWTQALSLLQPRFKLLISSLLLLCG